MITIIEEENVNLYMRVVTVLTKWPYNIQLQGWTMCEMYLHSVDIET